MKLTFKQLMNHPIYGNAMNDMPLMDAIDVFVGDESNPMEQRCKAIDKLDTVMGIASKPATEVDVAQYMEMLK